MAKQKYKNKLDKIEDKTDTGNGVDDDFQKLFKYRTDKLINLTRGDKDKIDTPDDPPDVPPDVKDQVDNMIEFVDE